MTSRRYAEGTAVTVESSRGEITGILAKHGVERMAWASEPAGDTLQFQVAGQSYRFYIERPTVAAVQAQAKADGKDLRYISDWGSKVTAEWRRRWRAHVLLLKAKLEFAAAGDSTVAREFMPYLVLRDGRTLETAIADGGMKLLGVGVPA